jgi:2-iminobutanoate/2-iminopropanoate deaminase
VSRQIIETAEAASSSLFGQAIKAGSTAINLPGIVGIDPKTNQPAGVTIQVQTQEALSNCEAILCAAATSLSNVAHVYVLLARADDGRTFDAPVSSE